MVTTRPSHHSCHAGHVSQDTCCHEIVAVRPRKARTDSVLGLAVGASLDNLRF